jgi:hypothetical protein
MADGTVYYAITITAQGTSFSAYISMTPTSDLTIAQGGVTFTPTQATLAMANIYPETLQLQAPAGAFTSGVTIITGASEIAGRVMVSPPVNVAVIVTLYGAGGQQLGQMIVDPGTGSKTFAFPVSGSNAIPAGDVDGVLRALLPPATA